MLSVRALARGPCAQLRARRSRSRRSHGTCRCQPRANCSLSWLKAHWLIGHHRRLSRSQNGRFRLRDAFGFRGLALAHLTLDIAGRSNVVRAGGCGTLRRSRSSANLHRLHSRLLRSGVQQSRSSSGGRTCRCRGSSQRSLQIHCDDRRTTSVQGALHYPSAYAALG